MSGQVVACVVGATGGIGRAIIDTLAADQTYTSVVGISRRRADTWPRDDRFTWIEADILNEMSLALAAEKLAVLGEVVRIVVATGRLHGMGLEPEKSMRAVSLARLVDSFAVNAAGPALVAKHFLPLTPRSGVSVFAALSARVGSIGDNHLGGWYAYRASKTALNMLIHTLAIEHRRTRPKGICVALHPGTVDTPLSAPFQAGVPKTKLFSTKRAAEALVSVIDELTPEANGGFLAWDGSPIPW